MKTFPFLTLILRSLSPLQLGWSWTRDSIPDETVGGAVLLDVSGPSLRWQEGIALSRYVTPQKERMGEVFCRPNQISSRMLVKEDILHSEPPYPVSFLHNLLLFTGAQLFCCCCQRRGCSLPGLQPPRS